MRLTAFHVENYGNLDALSLALDPKPGCINLIVAPNGTGKSVLRQAFIDLLFGVPGQTPMGFRYGYPAMRLRTEALGPDGPVQFGRRKGNANTLVDAADARLAPAVLDRLLGGMDRTGLERLFALDTAGLRSGGRRLLESGGALADALLSGAGGLRSATELRRTLQGERDNLAPERRSATKPFYKALDSWTDARNRLQAGTLRPEARAGQDAALQAARTAQRRANAAEVQASSDLARLERIRRTAPDLRRLQTAEDWLAAHPDAPTLPPCLGEDLASALAKVQASTRTLAELHARQASTASSLDAVQPDDALLHQAGLIESQEREAGVAAQAELDLPECRAGLEKHRLLIAGLLHDLGAAPGTDPVTLVPPILKRESARHLIERHAELAGQRAGLPARIAALERLVADVPPSPGADMAPLALLLAEIRMDGAPAPRLASARKSATQATAAAATALAAVPGWTGCLPTLAALAPPPLALLDALDAVARAASHTLTEAASRLKQAEQHLADLLQQAATLASDLPDAAAVAAARHHRDAGWHLIYQQAFTTNPPDAAEAAIWAGEVPLPLAYEQAAAAADAAADRRAQEAEVVERAALLRQNVEIAEPARDDVQEAHAVARENSAAAHAAWAAAIQPMNLPAAAPLAAARDVLTCRMAALEAAQAEVEAAAALTALQQQQGDWISQLATVLGQPAAPLPTLLRAADLAVSAAGVAREARAAAVAKCSADQATLAAARDEEAQLASALDGWRTEWAAALAALGRPAGEGPHDVRNALGLLERLEAELAAAGALESRVRNMDNCVARFTEQVANAVALLAPALDGTASHKAVRGLRRQLDAAMAADAVRNELRHAMEGISHDVAAACTAGNASQAQLDAILAAAGAATVAEAQARITLSEENARYRADRARLTADLLAGDGLPLDQLYADAAAADPDSHATATDQARRDQQAAGAQAQLAAAEAKGIEDKLERDAKADIATQAAHDQAAAAAYLGRVLEDALLVAAASALLGHGVAAVERDGDSPLVRRIGEAFQMLTTGTYTGVSLRPDDEDGLQLVALERAYPNEPRAIKELSEGTQDQLFLALRLVAIEDHVAARPALPFLGDDILQSFDDARAVAALHALLALSKHVQVVLLTHHEHIGALAEALLPGSLHIQRIGSAHP